MYINKNPEYFLTIVSEGSFSKAAEKLFISQPYLSQYVLRIEKEFGVTLLDRSRSPMQLTEAGRIYVQYLESGLRLEQKLLSDLGELSRDREQTLRLALSSWRAGVQLPCKRTYRAAKYNLRDECGDCVRACGAKLCFLFSQRNGRPLGAEQRSGIFWL